MKAAYLLPSLLKKPSATLPFVSTPVESFVQNDLITKGFQGLYILFLSFKKGIIYGGSNDKETSICLDWMVAAIQSC